jgi:sRNA-binding carbon storage regulator CsrA
MLMLTRYDDEGIEIFVENSRRGDHIYIEAKTIGRGRMKIGFDASRTYRIMRYELMTDKERKEYLDKLRNDYFNEGGGI